MKKTTKPKKQYKYVACHDLWDECPGVCFHTLAEAKAYLLDLGDAQNPRIYELSNEVKYKLVLEEI